jgi:hypothetical protein
VAQVQISEAATGIDDDMAGVGLAMQRAVDKTETMKTRAAAVEELQAAGTFEDLTAIGPGHDNVDRQLEQLGQRTRSTMSSPSSRRRWARRPSPQRSQPANRRLPAQRDIMTSSRVRRICVRRVRRICVRQRQRGGWEIELPDRRRTVCLETLEDAKRVAYLSAAHRHPCELIVQDAYHRVIQREFIDGGE